MYSLNIKKNPPPPHIMFDVTKTDNFLSPSEQAKLIKHLSNIVFVPKIGPNPYNNKALSISSNVYCWMSSRKDAIYAFSRNHHNALLPRPFTAVLERLRKKIEATTGKSFNSVLLNMYPHGGASLSAHSDNDPWLGDDFDVPSLSLGAERTIVFKPRKGVTPPASWKGKKTFRVSMPSGSLVMMRGKGTQAGYTHEVPGTTKPIGPRFNLTFRNVLKPFIPAKFKGPGCARIPIAVELELRLRTKLRDVAVFDKARKELMAKPELLQRLRAEAKELKPLTNNPESCYAFVKLYSRMLRRAARKYQHSSVVSAWMTQKALGTKSKPKPKAKKSPGAKPKKKYISIKKDAQ